VTFAVQNLTTDPPFSKLDLVSCRNVLIYLEPETQARLLSLFHFALNPGGYLFLGSAEGVGPLDELFAPMSKRRRIFRRVAQDTRRPLDLPLSPFSATDGSRVSAKVTMMPWRDRHTNCRAYSRLRTAAGRRADPSAQECRLSEPFTQPPALTNRGASHEEMTP
jgi:hypothetical protein